MILLLIDARSGEIVDANSGALSFYGYDREEVMGMPISRIDERVLEEPPSTVNDQEEVRSARHRLKDGSARDVHTHSSRLRVDGRELVCWVVQDANTYERPEAERQLHSAALEATANGVLITDATGTIQWVNDAFTRMTGYTLSEVRGRNPRILRSGHNPDGLYRSLWDTVSRGSVWRGELINQRKDGSLYTEEQTITPVRDEVGTIRHFIAIKQDVTAAKRDQAEIELRVRQQQAVAELGQLALQGTPLDVLFQRAVGRVGTVLGVELVAMLEFIPSRQVFVPRAGVGWKPGLVRPIEIANDPTTEAGFTLLTPMPFT